MKSEFSRQILEKYSKIKFYQNPCSGSRVIPCGERQTGRQTDGQTDMTKLIVVFIVLRHTPKGNSMTWAILRSVFEN